MKGKCKKKMEEEMSDCQLSPLYTARPKMGYFRGTKGPIKKKGKPTAEKI